jgi:hypothetical protein
MPCGRINLQAQTPCRSERTEACIEFDHPAPLSMSCCRGSANDQSRRLPQMVLGLTRLMCGYERDAIG